MIQSKFSKILMTSALGVLVFSVAPVSAQQLLINPYPNGGEPKSVVEDVEKASRQISNRDTGVDIGEEPKRLSLDEFEPEKLAPILVTDEDSLVVRLPVLGSAPAAPVRPTAPVVVDVLAPPPAAALVKREVKVPSEMPPPPKALSAKVPSSIVSPAVAKVESSTQSTRALLDSVLESAQNLPKDRAVDVVPSASVMTREEALPLPVVVEEVAEAPEVIVSPAPVMVEAEVVVPEPAVPELVVQEVVVPVVAPAPRIYSNAQELGVMLGERGTPISAEVASVVPSEPIAVMVTQEDTMPIGESMDLIQAQKMPRFAERPIGGVSAQGDPLEASYLARARGAKSRGGWKPVEEKLVPLATPLPSDMEPALRPVDLDKRDAPRSRIARNRIVPMEAPEALVPVAVDSVAAVAVSGEGSGVSGVSRYASLPPGVQVIRRPDVQAAASGYDTYRADATREYSASREWKVLQGYELRDVLYRWSERAGVTLVWDTSGHYMTQEPLRVESTYEKAVQGLLNQYVGKDNRPTGVIYKDPQTAERYLVIQTAG